MTPPTPNAQAQVAGGQVPPVYTFDPNAPPEAKAAEAGKGREKLKSGRDDIGNGGVGQSTLRQSVCHLLTRR